MVPAPGASPLRQMLFDELADTARVPYGPLPEPVRITEVPDSGMSRHAVVPEDPTGSPFPLCHGEDSLAPAPLDGPIVWMDRLLRVGAIAGCAAVIGALVMFLAR